MRLIRAGTMIVLRKTSRKRTPPTAWHPDHCVYHLVAAHQKEEALARGFLGRHFFPHRFYCLPKCGPDGFKLAGRMRGTARPNACWEIVLYAEPPMPEDLSPDLFFDDDIIWHQQQFGRAGQVATANLVAEGRNLYTLVHVSDLVQRISRRRAHKTRVESYFKGWHLMLLNAIMHVALDRGCKRVFSASARLSMQNTDPARTVTPELFERIYDRDIHRQYRADADGDWWRIDLAANADRILRAETRHDPAPPERTICICHDVERGLGHTDTDPAFARAANQRAPADLAAMLRCEHQAGVRSTYHVVGLLLEDLRGPIETGGHALAFHSYDHRVEKAPSPLQRQLLCFLPRGKRRASQEEQLARCRQIDYRLKGYRPPRSNLTGELSPANLCHHNFEWLASSAWSLKLEQPRFHDRLIWLPIAFDDFDLYRGRLTYPEWEAQALRYIETNTFTALGFHDCYAPWWLDHYPAFLEKVRRLGELKTLDEVAAEVTLAHAV